jgi:hypothetical protein
MGVQVHQQKSEDHSLGLNQGIQRATTVWWHGSRCASTTQYGDLMILNFKMINEAIGTDLKGLRPCGLGKSWSSSYLVIVKVRICSRRP